MAASTVFIVGAGPVGLASALLLADAGIPVHVLERSPEQPRDMRASTFHPPTLDMLTRLGVTEELVGAGLVAAHTQQWDRQEGLIADFDLSLLAGETRHPFRLQCEQWKLTDMLAQRLSGHPLATISLGTEVTDVDQDEDGVTLRGRCGGETVSHRGSYVVGADGAWSTVRQSAGIAFEGYTYPERFLFISTDFEYAERFTGISYVNYFSDPDEWCVLLRVPSMWRVLFPVATDIDDKALLADDSIESHLQRLATRPAPYRTIHRTIYRVHQRVAARFRHGRILLAGDAAHINNPLGGMGMNGGLHDAFNLSDKLIEVLRGGDPALLDRYERQRRSIAIEYINAGTAQNKKHLEERDPAARRQHLDQLRRTAADPGLARTYLRQSSMLDALRQAAEIH
ncbi:FAD-dependent monooxygenase [Pigmentiphaga sp. GD03639]|uniref:FAD-dependent oxidoreductase n=1 Tax=unclassified Pigmentiphaga TaxID=2626614 RepID=UPI000B422B22|nr:MULTISPECIES: NAD(P)/FAD-dependent oxidoreductase [unclassified Pigmentiphaga]MDH2237447.1 FAD-dependent monooxygenase [Pigmentiphaga sp. GD03639]OVZ63110.1 hypothetical protein CDO46_12595 [Pigmentiphaga sp. NML030171]